MTAIIIITYMVGYVLAYLILKRSWVSMHNSWTIEERSIILGMSLFSLVIVFPWSVRYILKLISRHIKWDKPAKW